MSDDKQRITGLIDESPLLVYPSLAQALKNINKAIIVQQLHFLINVAKKSRNHYVLIDGRWWVYNSYEEWREYFSWLSKGAIQRLFLEMEHDGYILSRQGVKNPRDRRKWYTIDYDAWQRLVVPMITKCDHGDDHKLRSCTATNCDDDISETTSETTTDICAPDGASSDDKPQNEPEETPQARFKRVVFNPVFDALEQHFWETNGDSGAYASDDDRDNGGRIAKVAWWHCGKEYKGIRKIGTPATEDNVHLHVEAIAKFAAWVKGKNITLHDLAKYVEWYGKWHSEIVAKAAKQKERQQRSARFDLLEPTEEELQRVRDFLARERNRSRRLS